MVDSGAYCLPCSSDCCSCNLDGKCTKCCTGYKLDGWACTACNGSCSCTAMEQNTLTYSATFRLAASLIGLVIILIK